MPAAGSGPSWSASGPSVSGTLTEDTEITEIYLSTYVTGGVGTLTYTSSDLPTGLEITAGATSITGTPTGDTYPTSETTANIDVEDEDGNIDTFTMNIPIIYAAAGSGPSWSASGPSVSGTLTEDTEITEIYLSTYVTGGVGTLTYTSSDLPTGLEITAGATSITGTPTGDTYPTSETTANIDVEDEDGNIDTFTMNIPIIYAAAVTNVSWNATLTGFPTTLVKDTSMTSFDLSDSITDAPADKTFNVVGIKPSWLTINNSTGQLTGTPIATAPAISVTFRIRDTNNASNSDTITVSFPSSNCCC